MSSLYHVLLLYLALSKRPFLMKYQLDRFNVRRTSQESSNCCTIYDKLMEKGRMFNMEKKMFILLIRIAIELCDWSLLSCATARPQNLSLHRSWLPLALGKAPWIARSA
jgi:hypothetical protein